MPDITLYTLDGAIIGTGPSLVAICEQQKMSLAKANLHGANLHGANLHGADLRAADLRAADLSNTILIDGGTERRGCRIVGIPSGDRLMISAGSRFFDDITQAREHWNDEDTGPLSQRYECLARVELIYTLWCARKKEAHGWLRTDLSRKKETP